LEERLLLALLGVGPQIEPPDIFYDTGGTLSYNATTHVFHSDATPTSILFAVGSRPVLVQLPKDYWLNLNVGNNGQFLGGGTNQDLYVEGQVDVNRDGVMDYSGVLLTARVTAFGYLEAGATDQYDFRLIPTGGALMSFFEGEDVGMTMTSLNSTFTGNFGVNFTGRAQGVLGAIPAQWSSLAGGVSDDADSGIENAAITLTGTDIIGAAVNRTVDTAADGAFAFGNLRPGTYSIAEAQPAGYLDGDDAAGSLGGAVADDLISEIAVTGGAAGVGYAFGEVRPAGLSGAVVCDGVGIEGASITLSGVDDRGAAVSQTVDTAADGAFAFAGLRPGTYSIAEAQPAGYLDGDDAAGSLGGTVADDLISEIAVAGGAAGVGYAFNEILPASLSGIVWLDANDDGLVDFGEKSLPGVGIRLTGVDDRGQAVDTLLNTDDDGACIFLNLRPGVYAVSETQPAGYLDGQDVVGTAGGVLANDSVSEIALASGVDAYNYNFGERPQTGAALTAGQTATIGFWQNKNGQNLIKSLNGGAMATQLGAWLAATFPNMFGALAGKTNADVAAFYQSRFKVKGQKLDAQVLATALACYVTSSNLAGTAATSYGFLVTEYGVSIATYDIGASGAAFGVANYSILAVMDILATTDAQTVNGVLYNGDQFLRNLANMVYDGINNSGDIG
jgi:hypothetical protein